MLDNKEYLGYTEKVNDCKGGVNILKSERKSLIEEKIAQDGVVSLEDLVNLLKTSESTVRRDLDELEAEHKLRRIHGGAERIHPLQEELTNQQKSIKNVQAKQKIARQAVQLIEAGEVIFIDAGTTTELLIDQLEGVAITVVTNSIHHAVKLVEKNLKTIIIGGDVKSSTDACVGPVALKQIAGLNFDKAFIGINGIDEAFLTTPDMAEAAVKAEIIRNSRQTYVLADASKLGQVSFVKVASVAAVDLVLEKTDQAIVTTLKEQTRVIEV